VLRVAAPRLPNAKRANGRARRVEPEGVDAGRTRRERPRADALARTPRACAATPRTAREVMREADAKS
jgi:hypothetical protein